MKQNHSFLRLVLFLFCSAQRALGSDCFTPLSALQSDQHLSERLYPASRQIVPLFISSADIQSNSWKRLFVRSLSDLESVQSQYIANHTEAMAFFDRWFRGTLSLSYDQMLRQTHAIGAIGAQGNLPFSRVTRKGKILYQSSLIQFGRFRDETNEGDYEQVDITTYVASQSSNNSFPFLSGLSEVRQQRSLIREAQKKFESWNGWRVNAMLRNENFDIPAPPYPPDLLILQRSWTISVPGIPHEALPEVRFGPYGEAYGGELTFSYPKKKYLSLYRQRMAALMDQITHMSEQPSVNRTEFLNLLADYYRISVISLPFLRMNNSLLMGEVNYLLQFFGLRGMLHEYLDVAPCARGPEAFRRVFSSAVLRAQD